MSSLSRLKATPGLVVRSLVALGAVVAIAEAGVAFVSGETPFDVDALEEALALAIVGALARRYGIALPGNGFSSYILGVMAYATLDRGWPFAVVVIPVAMLAGDLALRRVPVAVALDNARSEEHTSELQSRRDLVCRLLLEKKKTTKKHHRRISIVPHSDATLWHLHQII